MLPGSRVMIGVALAGLASLASGCRPVRVARPNIVLITIESLRPDHLSMFAGPRVTAPNLRAMAAEGMVYGNARSVTSWTLPAHASIFTGLYPTAHRTDGPVSRLDDSYTTLAEVLAQEGYETAGVAGGPYLRHAHNLNQGFAHYDDTPAAARPAAAHADSSNDRVTASLEHFMDRRDPDRPFFLFAYFWDPHYDYIPPEPFSSEYVDETCEPIAVRGYEVSNTVHAGISEAQVRYLESQYDGEIRWTDTHLGRLLDRLRAEGLWENTVIIVTADHGEEFFEHGGKGHKNNLYVESLHVPLVIKYAPGGPSGEDDRPVSLVDIYPTILDLAGAQSPTPHQGMSLLSMPLPDDRPIFSELLSIRYAGRSVSKFERWSALRQGSHKLVSIGGGQRLELYDTGADPGEAVNLAQAHPEVVTDMLATLRAWHEGARAIAHMFPEGGEADLDEEMLERLRSLGYVQ